MGFQIEAYPATAGFLTNIAAGIYSHSKNAVIPDLKAAIVGSAVAAITEIALNALAKYSSTQHRQPKLDYYISFLTRAITALAGTKAGHQIDSKYSYFEVHQFYFLASVIMTISVANRAAQQQNQN